MFRRRCYPLASSFDLIEGRTDCCRSSRQYSLNLHSLNDHSMNLHSTLQSSFAYRVIAVPLVRGWGGLKKGGMGVQDSDFEIKLRANITERLPPVLHSVLLIHSHLNHFPPRNLG